ncbi:hypothetical protein FRACA_100043 [Frankia canadensis]|uniref:Uncharacterized protein n=1 Tax=Frankia canadensis TaxID=1836972 RepID=A0A2I2KIH6_9ACTN|nr:hypothetical protein FRACA_100043 [Frankia canadensis]SOU52765.1 hypothetical protein FRACA_100043 [Frankia canadensis]
MRAGVDEALARWRPIALSELEGLDDAPAPGWTLGSGTERG